MSAAATNCEWKESRLLSQADKPTQLLLDVPTHFPDVGALFQRAGRSRVSPGLGDELFAATARNLLAFASGATIRQLDRLSHVPGNTVLM